MPKMCDFNDWIECLAMTMADKDEKVPRPSRQGQYQLSHSCFLIPSKHNSSYKPLGPTKGENSVELFFKKNLKKKNTYFQIIFKILYHFYLKKYKKKKKKKKKIAEKKGKQ
jgi:hypothetical protein